MWNLKIVQMDLFTKQKQTHGHRKQTCLPKGTGGSEEAPKRLPISVPRKNVTALEWNPGYTTLDWIFEVLVEPLPWRQPTLAIFRLLQTVRAPTLSALDRSWNAQPLRIQACSGRGPRPGLRHPSERHCPPLGAHHQRWCKHSHLLLVPLRKTGGVDNEKSFLFGFGKHDNEFLVAPNYVLLKIILKKCLHSLSTY